jgi:hypothetical protein
MFPPVSPVAGIDTSIMNFSEIEKSKVHVTVDLIKYVPDSEVNKTIFNRPAGNISKISSDKGKESIEKTIPFDTFLQITEENAEVVLNKPIVIYTIFS